MLNYQVGQKVGARTSFENQLCVHQRRGRHGGSKGGCENQLCVHQRLVGMVAAQSIAGCRSNATAMLPPVQYDAHNDHVMDGSEYLKARNNVRCGRCRHWVVKVLGGLPHAGRQA